MSVALPLARSLRERGLAVAADLGVIEGTSAGAGAQDGELECDEDGDEEGGRLRRGWGRGLRAGILFLQSAVAGLCTRGEGEGSRRVVGHVRGGLVLPAVSSGSLGGVPDHGDGGPVEDERSSSTGLAGMVEREGHSSSNHAGGRAVGQGREEEEDGDEEEGGPEDAECGSGTTPPGRAGTRTSGSNRTSSTSPSRRHSRSHANSTTRSSPGSVQVAAASPPAGVLQLPTDGLERAEARTRQAVEAATDAAIRRLRWHRIVLALCCCGGPCIPLCTEPCCGLRRGVRGTVDWRRVAES